MKLPSEVVSFFKKQSYVIFATVDREGWPHSVAKGIVDIDEDGTISMLDLYRGKTYGNLQTNENASITAIDEHAFIGYTLKGTACIVEEGSLDDAVKKKWRRLLRARITQRIIKNIRTEVGGKRPHEAHMPDPEYLIVFKCEEVVDLSHFRGRG